MCSPHRSPPFSWQPPWSHLLLIKEVSWFLKIISDHETNLPFCYKSNLTLLLGELTLFSLLSLLCTNYLFLIKGFAFLRVLWKQYSLLWCPIIWKGPGNTNSYNPLFTTHNNTMYCKTLFYNLYREQGPMQFISLFKLPSPRPYNLEKYLVNSLKKNVYW